MQPMAEAVAFLCGARIVAGATLIPIAIITISPVLVVVVRAVVVEMRRQLVTLPPLMLVVATQPETGRILLMLPQRLF